MRLPRRQGWRRVLLAAIGALGLAVAVLPAGAAPGYLTDKPAQVRTVAPGWSVQPLLSVGDVVGNYQMAAIPDGLGAFDNGDGTFTLLMNHELTSKDKENLSDARVSQLVVDKATLAVLSARYLLDGSEGYRRLCSATLVGPAEGFAEPIFFTGEEATDGSHGGIVVGVNGKTGQRTDLPWLGKLSHENAFVAPGFPGKTVVFTTDDNAPGYLYMYAANTPADVMAGKGQLYVLAIDNGKTEGDLTKGKRYTGRWVPIGQDENKDAKALQGTAAAKGGLAFARPEDATYDRNDPAAIFVNTTGRSGYKDSAGKEINARGKTYRVKMDPADPTRVTELTVVLDGNTGDDILNPDNIEADRTGLLIQEDINSEFRTRPGRTVRYDFATGTVSTVVELVQRDFKGQPIGGDRPGEWETSGVLDLSAILGPNTWLFDVQAHSLRTAQLGGTDEAGQLLVLRYGVSTPGLPNTGGGWQPQPVAGWWAALIPFVIAVATAAIRRRARRA